MNNRLPLTLLGLSMTAIGGGFSWTVLMMDVPGYLLSWSLTVLAYGLWLWPVRGLVHRGRARVRQGGPSAP